MPKAIVLMEQYLDLSERYRVELKVFEVEKSHKFPEGIKVSFVLLDLFQRQPRLLIDNHAPYGFHVHEELPKSKDVRRLLPVTNYAEALDQFWCLVKEIVRYEN